MMVVIDVIGLYDNMRLMEIILAYSIFEFDEQMYQQQFGTSMGSKPAPSYTNLFMTNNIDEKIKKITEKYQENGEIPIKATKCFLDDIF